MATFFKCVHDAIMAQGETQKKHAPDTDTSRKITEEISKRLDEQWEFIRKYFEVNWFVEEWIGTPASDIHRP